MKDRQITAVDRDEIRTRLLATTLRMGQIDVNGKCNAKCWYCPVKYQGNPKEFAVQMPLDKLDHILGNLRASPLIPSEFRFLYSCHYNEVLLYQHFEEMLPLFRRHGFATMILSNGTPLTPQKTDLIVANKDVILGVALNIPALDRDDWSRKVGLPISMHKLLLRNLDYLHEKYPATIQINCDISPLGQMDKGMVTSKKDADAIAAAFKARYPKFRISLLERLSDRAGRLEEHAVLTRHNKAQGRVIGCAHSGAKDGGRVFGWVHINAKGDLFLCCDDYEMKYCFGNLLTESFEDAWMSDKHIEIISSAFSAICRNCQFRIEEACSHNQTLSTITPQNSNFTA
jgi:radical SAM protein with 4Fe4S-binding SPASM domain